MMEEVPDNKPAPTPFARFTMVETPTHFDAVMADEEQPEQAAQPVSVFRMLQEEQRYM